MKQKLLFIVFICVLNACSNDPQKDFENYQLDREMLLDTILMTPIESYNVDSIELQSYQSYSQVIDVVTYENPMYRASVTLKVRAELLVAYNHYVLASLTPYLVVSEGYADIEDHTLPLATTWETNSCYASFDGENGINLNYKLNISGTIYCSRAMAAALECSSIYVNVQDRLFGFKITNLGK